MLNLKKVFLFYGLIMVFFMVLVGCGNSDNLDTYTITFHPNGGEGSMASLPVVENTKIILPVNAFTPQTAEYRFAGWNTEADGNGTGYANGAEFEMGSEDVILYAVWELIPTYTITFHSNGGEGEMDPLTDVLENTIVVLPINIFTPPAGYTFAGWSIFPNENAMYADEAEFAIETENVNLYAVWEAIPAYKIIFHSNGGTGEMDSLTDVLENTTIVLPANVFTPPTGYTFAGWSIIPNGGAVYEDEAQFGMGTEDVTLYAVWEAIPACNITFDLNGGTGIVPSRQFAYGEQITDIYLGAIGFSDHPRMQGHHLIGFFDAPIGGTKYFSFTDQFGYSGDFWLQSGRLGSPEYWDKQEDTTLSAQWEECRCTNPCWWLWSWLVY